MSRGHSCAETAESEPTLQIFQQLLATSANCFGSLVAHGLYGMMVSAEKVCCYILSMNRREVNEANGWEEPWTFNKLDAQIYFSRLSNLSYSLSQAAGNIQLRQHVSRAALVLHLCLHRRHIIKCRSPALWARGRRLPSWLSARKASGSQVMSYKEQQSPCSA